nr:cysteine-rich receptor-like protein kinase 25 [Quercus suber]
MDNQPFLKLMFMYKDIVSVEAKERRRGDVSNSTCQSCVSYATQDITTRCPSNNSAIIWYDECMLRYSNVNFFGQVQTSPEVLMWNVGNTTSPDQPNFSAIALMNFLTGTAVNDDLLFHDGNLTASNGSDQTYGLVQCTRDINSSGCSSCLSQLIKDAESCCQSKIGLRILTPSCSIRYETYSFFQQPPVPPPSAPAPPAPPQSSGDGGKKTKKTVIITISSIASIAIVAAVLGFWYYSSSGRRKRNLDGDKSQELQLRNNLAGSLSMHLDSSIYGRDDDNRGEMNYFNLSTILTATNNFSDANKLGEGGFGPVYRGKLINGNEIAVKRLSMKSKQGEEKLLVYEYMANTSLDVFLFDPKKCKELDWAKPNTNRVVGTYGYMAPEYAMEGLFSIKSDIYSFGILLLEIASGKKNSGFYHPEREESLLSYAWRLWNDGKGLEFIDQTIVDTCPISEEDVVIGNNMQKGKTYSLGYPKSLLALLSAPRNSL